MLQINNSDLDILNREYSPSSCIDDIYVYIQHYIKLSREAKVQANNQKPAGSKPAWSGL
jgi:arylformamidase